MFTALTPHLKYGLSSRRRAPHWSTLHGESCWIVVISTIEMFNQGFNHEVGDGSKFWSPVKYPSVTIDETQWLKISRTPIGKFRKGNSMVVKMDSRDYNMHLASCILCLEPQYTCMLIATPLVNGIKDLNSILHFVERLSWLTLQLLPNTFNSTLNIENHWVTDRSNMSDTEYGAWISPVADPYMQGPEFGSLVHWTPMACYVEMLPPIGEVGKLKKTMQTSNILIRQHFHKDSVGKRGLCWADWKYGYYNAKDYDVTCLIVVSAIIHKLTFCRCDMSHYMTQQTDVVICPHTLDYSSTHHCTNAYDPFCV